MTNRELCITDHVRLDQLFSDYFGARESRRYQLMPFICEAVRRHMAFDAEILFPCLARAIGDWGLAARAAAAYAAINEFVEELLHPDPGDLEVSERVHRLAEMVARHDSAFESARGAFAQAPCSKTVTAAISSLLQRRQREWLPELGSD